MKKPFAVLIVVMLFFGACNSNPALPEEIDTLTTIETSEVTTTEFVRIEYSFPHLTPQKDNDNIKVKQYVHTQGDVDISYPEIKNAKSIVNQSIKEAATRHLKPERFPLPEHDITLFVINSDCEVKYLDSRYVSVIFWGEEYFKDKDDPERIDGKVFAVFHTITIDLTTGKSLELGDVIEINDDFISMVKNEARKYSTEGYYNEFFEGDELEESIRDLIFYLTESSLVIRSWRWYNDGFISEIPYEKLSGLLKIK